MFFQKKNPQGFKWSHVLVEQDQYIRASQREDMRLKNRIKKYLTENKYEILFFAGAILAYYFGIDPDFVFGKH